MPADPQASEGCDASDGARIGSRAIGLLLVGVLMVGAVSLVRCSEERAGAAPDGPHFVTTIPPFAAILNPVVGERGRVTALLHAGDSPHTYEPRPSDVRRAETASAVFYGAPHLDAWAADLSSRRTLALLDLVPSTYRLPAVTDVHARHGEDGLSIDPHFWTDPLVVHALLPALADTLCTLDAEGCAVYTANADTFAARLEALDAEVEALVEPVRAAPVFLAQPFFQYFLHRYGPQLVGVVEPHPGNEPSPRALEALVDRARRAGVRAILTQHQLPPRAAEAVAEGAGIPIVTLDPLGSADRSYPELLRRNAETLNDALRPSEGS